MTRIALVKTYVKDFQEPFPEDEEAQKTLINCALRNAVLRNNLDDATTLMDTHSAKINSKGKTSHNTAAHVAAIKENLQALRWLYARGANLSLTNAKSETVLQLLKPEDYLAPDDEGNLLLHLVIYRGDLTAAKHILDLAPIESLFHANQREETPFDLLLELESEEFNSILLKRLDIIPDQSKPTLKSFEGSNLHPPIEALIKRLVLQFLIHLNQESPFKNGHELSGFIHKVKQVLECLSTGLKNNFIFISYPNAVFQDHWGPAQTRSIPCSKILTYYQKLITQLPSSWRFNSILAHKIDFSIIRYKGRAYVPSLALMNLILVIDFAARTKINSKVLCLGKWFGKEIKDVDIATAQTAVRPQRLIYCDSKVTSVHNHPAHPQRMYVHDLLHVVQLYILFRDFPQETKILMAMGHKLAGNPEHPFRKLLDAESQNDFLETFLDGYHVLQLMLTQQENFHTALMLVLKLIIQRNKGPLSHFSQLGLDADLKQLEQLQYSKLVAPPASASLWAEESAEPASKKVMASVVAAPGS
jgi:hypothetical protein